LYFCRFARLLPPGSLPAVGQLAESWGQDPDPHRL